jgi:excinuclease ABC subunit C
MLFDAFPGFGPNRYDPTRSQSVLEQVNGKRPQDLRAAVREAAPKVAGVYGMLDPRNRLTYVGKAKNLRSRLLSYFRPNSRDAKAGKIVAQARAVVWETAPSEFAALLRELELIRTFCPSYNVMGQPGRRRFTYLHLGRTPAPYFFKHRDLLPKTIATYGPLPGSRRLGDAVRRLNDMFRLRDCPQSIPLKFADQRELFPVDEPAGCLRYDIGMCLGPCIAAITRPQYSRGVRAAKAFLDGVDAEPLQKLKQAMAEAAAAHQFERAASLRDRIDDLYWLQERLAWLQTARREFSFVYPVEGVWYVLRGGRVMAAVPAPHCRRSRKTALKAVDAIFPLGGGSSIIPNEMYDHVLLVSAWFRRHASEKERIFSPNEAREHCRELSAVA